MSEEKASVQMFKYLQLTDGEDKDKDKMSSNEFKVLFNISSYLKDPMNPNTSESVKKPKNKTILRNHSLPYKTSFSNKRYTNINNNNKETSYDDMLTIINTSKKNNNNSLTQKNKIKDNNPINTMKKRMKKVDLFNSLKYKNIKPKKDFTFKNTNFTFYQKDEKDKYKKNNSPKFFGSKIKYKESIPSPNKEKEKRQILDSKLQKVLSKSSNSIITSYLDRKKIDNLPVIYPLFLSYNNSYETQSEKFRVNKILEKFVQLKTQIVKDYKNREKIMKEFLLRNGINDKKLHTVEKLNNLNEYLKKPFKFDPKKTITDAIKEALNYKTNDILTDRNKLFPVNLFNNYNNDYTLNKTKLSKNTKNVPLENSKSKVRNIYQNPISLKFEELKYDNEHLPKLIMELEENLEKIQNEGDERINKLRGGVKKLKQFKIKDKNKLLPNLCLVNEDFKGQYEYLINKANVKLQNNYNRQKHIKEINDRMYYNNLKKKYMDQGFSDEIKRKLKLTEYIILQRAKKKMFLEQFNKFDKPMKI